MIKQYRDDSNTYYIELEITDFVTYKYLDFIQTHQTHCPSKQLNLIWNEKIFLIEKASKLNPFASKYFMWIDAGICVYRDSFPPQNLNIELLKTLPIDKFIFTSSNNNTYRKFNDNEYYHFVSGTYMYHISFVDIITKLYSQYLDMLLPNNNWIYTDQVVLTHIYRDCPELFYKIGDGYGVIANMLFIN